MKYRQDIDGLRAVAVIPVVLFHAGVPGFGGGFVGVDVFFVISGYLITGILMRELDQKNFSLVNFYERRARRILPALSVVLFFSTVMSVVFLSPVALKDYARSLISVTTFSSNIYFYFTSGYFASASEEKPLLHTWSLAVEEQYYVFFPLILMWLWAITKRRNIIAVGGVASLASLALCEFLLHRDENDANFFLITSRAWELLAGSLLALVASDRSRKNTTAIDQIAGLGGLALILIPAVFYTDATPFPGIMAIPPVLGACMVIYFGGQRALASRFLALSPLVTIGLLSYSLYLWHQPLFAFLRILSTTHLSWVDFIPAIILSVIFAWASWKYIETPFRQKQKFDRTQIFKLSTASLVFFLVIGTIGHIFKGAPQRYSAPTFADTAIPSPLREQCHTEGRNFLKPENACRYFGDTVDWAVLGDSHVIEPGFALAKALEKQNRGLLHLSFSGCPPVFGYEGGRPGCSEWMQQSAAYLEEHPEIKNVLIGFRYTAFIYSAKDYVTRHSSLAGTDPRELYWQGMQNLIEKLARVPDRHIYVLYPIPELPENIQKMSVPTSIFHSTYRYDLEKSLSLNTYREKNHFILDKLDNYPWSEKIKPVITPEAFCNNRYCAAVANREALYFDEDHPSIYGAARIIQLVSGVDSSARIN